MDEKGQLYYAHYLIANKNEAFQSYYFCIKTLSIITNSCNEWVINLKIGHSKGDYFQVIINNQLLNEPYLYAKQYKVRPILKWFPVGNLGIHWLFEQCFSPPRFHIHMQLFSYFQSELSPAYYAHVFVRTVGSWLSHITFRNKALQPESPIIQQIQYSKMPHLK